MRLGISTHSEEELEIALAAGARLCGAGADLRDEAQGDEVGAAGPGSASAPGKRASATCRSSPSAASRRSAPTALSQRAPISVAVITDFMTAQHPEARVESGSRGRTVQRRAAQVNRTPLDTIVQTRACARRVMWHQMLRTDLYCTSCGVEYGRSGHCMAFRFKLGEPFEEGVPADRRRADRARAERSCKAERRSCRRRARDAQIAEAFAGAAAPHSPGDRRGAFSITRTRSCARSGLSLSGARDRHVLLETVEQARGGRGLRDARDSCQACARRIAAANGEGAPRRSAGGRRKAVSARPRSGSRRCASTGGGFDVVGAGLERATAGRAARSAKPTTS